jgi:glycosyltransferase involved in cell wall biosynthesis
VRILVITNLYPPHVLGGYEILCSQVVERLREHGHDVLVVTSDHGTGVHDAPAEGVSRSLRLYAPFTRRAGLERHRRLATDTWNARVTARAVRDFRPDRVFVWSQLRLTLGAARAAERSGVPVCYALNDEHLAGYVPVPSGPSPRSIVGSVVDRSLLRRLTASTLELRHVTCISHRLRHNLVARGVPVSHARVIYQGIPLARFPRKAGAERRPGPFRVLYTGQLHADKGVHTLVEAVGRIAARRGQDALSLTVVGAGARDYTAALERAAATMPITFLGFQDHERLPAVYRDHDAFVFPSIWQEPFGLTFLEAMASGTPVVSTTGGGHGECLIDGDNALTFEAGNADALACCLERLMASPWLGHRLADAGRQLVESHLNLDCYASGLEAFLETAA